MARGLGWFLLGALVVGGCGSSDDGEALVPRDAGWRNDAQPLPDYRPDRCAGDAGVGDGGVCGEGGVPSETDAGPPPPPPPPCNEVTFTYEDPDASTAWVSGTWLDWAASPAGGALELENDGAGTWSLTTLVEPIAKHQYKFIIDGGTDAEAWVADPMNPDTVDDGFGSFNSVLDVCGAQCGDFDEFSWRDTVMYFVMVDRFYDSDGEVGGPGPVEGATGAYLTGGDATRGPSGQYEGGDLAGVTARLEYMADLGVSAIWLSAPYENRDEAGEAIDPSADTHMYSGYHGYWPSPPNVQWGASGPSPRPMVESRIGTEDDLRTLVDSAHATVGANGHGMKVLFDYVMNHVDLNSGLYGDNPDWFARRDGSFALCGPENLWDDDYWGTRCAFTDYLPPFDFTIDAGRRWSINDALWWAQEFGIDGYRLDAIKHVPFEWLTDLRSALNDEILDPPGDRFYLVGETFAYDDRNLIRSFVDPETMLDGQFDFPFKARLCEAVFTPGGGLDGFSSWMDENDGFYGPGSLMTTWIGNHDIPRAIHFASREIDNCRQGSFPGNGWTTDFQQPSDVAPYERLGVAFAIMMTSPGIPLIYYGDEIGLAGGGDPDNRRLMTWDDSELNPHQIALRERVGQLARIRGANPVLARGRRLTHEATKDTWVYSMTGCEESEDVVVAINRADGKNTVAIPDGSWIDLLTDTPYAGGTHELDPRTFLVLAPAAE